MKVVYYRILYLVFFSITCTFTYVCSLHPLDLSKSLPVYTTFGCGISSRFLEL